MSGVSARYAFSLPGRRRAYSGRIEEGRIGEGLVVDILQRGGALGDVVRANVDARLEAVGGDALPRQRDGGRITLKAGEMAPVQPMGGAQEGCAGAAAGLGQ